jgi:hypothetical protein
VSSDPRVDELRQRLRSLGYLDAGVNRFVLGPARATRGPASIALLASLRVGTLAAVLLGPAAAIGLSARLPGLVTGPRDALVVAVYLGASFGISIAAAAFLAGLLVSFSRPALVGRGTLVSRVAGVVVTLLCLLYLTLWWQNVIADVGWSTPVWTMSALAIAAGISLLLGHAVAVMTSAVIVAAAGGAVNAGRAPTSSLQTSLFAGAVAFGAAALLLTWSSRAGVTTTNAVAALTVVPSGLRVRVIAVDGFDEQIFDTLSSSGRVPALTRAFEGALAQLDTRYRADDAGPDPARTWTTIATGQPPEIHGVQGLERRRVAGILGSVPITRSSQLGRAIRGATDLIRLTRPAVASGSERRARTFWEVAADAGLRTTVVNWWATWPARPEAGIVLSDRAALRLEHGGALDAELAPAALYEQLRDRWPALRARARSMAASALAASAGGSETMKVLQRSAELDALQLVLLSEVAPPSQDLSAVYLPGLDIAQHALLGSQAAQLGAEPAASSNDPSALTASAVAARLEALKDYYAALDSLLADTLVAGPDELVIVVTEPGRVGARSGARMAVRGRGVSAREAARGTGGSVAPTILYSLGLPVARDLSATPMLDLFTEEFRARYPVRFVDTYGEPVQKTVPRNGQPLDQEMIDRLRSLGYVR